MALDRAMGFQYKQYRDEEQIYTFPACICRTHRMRRTGNRGNNVGVNNLEIKANYQAQQFERS